MWDRDYWSPMPEEDFESALHLPAGYEEKMAFLRTVIGELKVPEYSGEEEGGTAESAQDSFDSASAAQGDKDHLVYGDERWTFADAHREVASAAAWLVAPDVRTSSMRITCAGACCRGSAVKTPLRFCWRLDLSLARGSF